MSSVDNEPILIWGAGAIGGTIGAYWARAGQPVAFVDVVPEHVAAIAARGIAIEGPIETFTAPPAPAFTPDKVTGTYRRIVLAVKAQHTADAARQLAPHLHPEGYVLSAQNGLNELAIAEVVGTARTMGCFVNFGSDYLEPGRILFGGRGAVVVGELDGRTTPRVEAMHALLRLFEPNAELTDNIWGYLWGKLGYGALLFATALTNESIADALASSRHFDLYRRLAGEAMQVARTRGVKPLGFNGYEPLAFMPGAAEAQTRASIDAMVAHNRRSAKSHSGIWRDIAVRKRKTEIDAQIAIIGRIGRDAGIATPLIDRLVALIHDVEDGKRPQSWATLDALAAT
ncbi:MAG TPA: 2-dehydropantoate 2-reductase [Vineibacter sp.]|nr:2-dehydropantoate 2-reductase [Vineibacter sp.]